MLQDEGLQRSIRATFGLVVIVVSLWMPWGEIGYVAAGRLDGVDTRIVVDGLDAFVRCLDAELPLWTIAATTAWLVTLSWLRRSEVVLPNPLLVIGLNGWSFVLLVSWVIKASNLHATIGLGVFVASLGWCMAFKAVIPEVVQVEAMPRDLAVSRPRELPPELEG